ncbi:MAG: hypothetical protein WA094_11585 [Candidatus Desulfobacillus denitrificans]|nr:hypothetical protein [Bacteroidia bacterium]HNQ57800.1 hypothetical protein [Candidatus Desulfobacillus denitrificans]
MGTLRKIAGFLNPIRPFRGAVASALRAPREGLEIIKDLASQLPQAGEPAALPQGYDPYERFREKCRKFGLDKRRLEVIELALLRSKRVMQLALVFTLAVSAGFLIAAENDLQIAQALLLLPFAAYASAKTLQLSVRLRQVRARALYTWPQFCQLFPSKAAMVGYLLDPEF